jgi:UDP-GlcNAc3NAcA epimerase
MKIITVLGARPQFIKAATVSRAITADFQNVQEVILHTGQHFDHNMNEVFFEEMGIPQPHYNLHISGLTHGAMTGRMLENIEEILFKEKPDILLVYGDTNSTLAGALAASKLHIPVAHVESGLRSYNLRMPEEINRILTDRISAYLFCPTDVAVQNLIKEGFDKIDCKIIQTGDVMQDAALHYAQHAKKPKQVDEKVIAQDFVLATIHRAENTDHPETMEAIVQALNTIHETDQHVILPLHPRTMNKLKQYGLTLHCQSIDPVSYLEMLYLLKHAKMVLTDSGGLQKEAYYFAKPCVTLRTETEWTELTDRGVNCLATLSHLGIVKAYHEMKDKRVETGLELYGNGNSAHKIVEALIK